MSYPEFIRSEKLPAKVIVIAGPTGSGKSRKAIELAKTCNGIIINADSRQIYKDLIIGAAQPIPDKVNKDSSWDIEGVKHYLYGFVDFKADFTLFDYQKLVQDLIKKIPDGSTPILVGGTGLYIDSVIFNFKLLPTQVKLEPQNGDSSLTRDKLNSLSAEELRNILGDSANILNNSDRNNPRRLIRLIERKGESYEKGTPLGHKYIVINPDIRSLEVSLRKRTEQMFTDGLIVENIRLRKCGFDFENKKTIGYSEFNQYPILERELTEAEIIELKTEITLHNRQYAKKQMTWFKKLPDNQ